MDERWRIIIRENMDHLRLILPFGQVELHRLLLQLLGEGQVLRNEELQPSLVGTRPRTSQRVRWVCRQVAR